MSYRGYIYGCHHKTHLQLTSDPFPKKTLFFPESTPFFVTPFPVPFLSYNLTYFCVTERKKTTMKVGFNTFVKMFDLSRSKKWPLMCFMKVWPNVQKWPWEMFIAIALKDLLFTSNWLSHYLLLMSFSFESYKSFIYFLRKWIVTSKIKFFFSTLGLIASIKNSKQNIREYIEQF